MTEDTPTENAGPAMTAAALEPTDATSTAVDATPAEAKTEKARKPFPWPWTWQRRTHLIVSAYVVAAALAGGSAWAYMFIEDKEVEAAELYAEATTVGEEITVLEEQITYNEELNAILAEQDGNLLEHTDSVLDEAQSIFDEASRWSEVSTKLHKCAMDRLNLAESYFAGSTTAKNNKRASLVTYCNAAFAEYKEVKNS